MLPVMVHQQQEQPDAIYKILDAQNKEKTRNTEVLKLNEK